MDTSFSDDQTDPDGILIANMANINLRQVFIIDSLIRH